LEGGDFLFLVVFFFYYKKKMGWGGGGGFCAHIHITETPPHNHVS